VLWLEMRERADGVTRALDAMMSAKEEKKQPSAENAPERVFNEMGESPFWRAPAQFLMG